MPKVSAWLCLSLCAGLLAATADATQTERLVFLSTQLRPIGEAQKMRNFVLKEFPQEVDYVTDLPQRFAMRVEAERQAGMHTIDVVGALHGELQALVPLDAMVPLDDLSKRLAGRGIPDPLLTLGKFGTAHQLYIPWMQASYIMVANKQALPYLPSGADINALSYDQLATWASTLQQKTGKRLLGFPAGPHGLMHRFFEGFLYPSHTGGVVVPFRSEAAEAMWMQFASLWKSVNPNSTSYDFMAQPLLSGEVWIGFDHIARVLDALRQKPNEFVAFPAPAGPKGRGYMPILVGLAVVKGTPGMAEAMALIDYLTQPETQITLARTVGFFPVVKAKLPADLDPGLRMGADAIAKMQSAKDALPALPPIGFGQRDAEFDRVFLETFQLIVLRGQKARPVLEREAETLQRLMNESGVPCWQPDPPGRGACQVQ
ncbi:ABC transporter substrate-binding protein [Bradyrhizobium sp. CCGUVB1N3]|uniref:ABC transporter substrate-binding protein n=1 Tax=Bradyrhizobium sp. CCGUVB1N3 TaxID=2949629 RepID=UPI0020B43D39|nr:ABC transporter substrate-binding protein [Bradyrhizobium sp. CCGUVB1N3]MCP3476263.1 ABC transporter substrate-binding protein [Bradyrhizobium sp. CCGUVB1N3]